MKHVFVAALAAPLFLAACAPSSGPPIPITPPAIAMPEYVQKACQVLQWAVPAAQAFVSWSADIQRYVDMAQPALAACAAGNADASIVAIASALQDLLYKRGVRAPVGVPVLHRR